MQLLDARPCRCSTLLVQLFAGLPVACVVALYAKVWVCVGFAMMEAMLVTAAALQKFKFEPSTPNQQMPLAQPRITLRPAAVNVRLIPR